MLSASPIKTDLIIGMTLAELFLLILLVVWYSQGTGAGPNWREIAEQRQREIDSLNQKLDAQKKEIEKWRAVSEFWRTRLGVDPPASVQQLAAALGTTQGKGIMEELKRGLPRCDENNVLAEVTVLNGTTEVHVYAPVKKMQEWPGSAAARVPSAGDLVKDGGEIQRFLNSVVSFYDY